MKLTVGLCALLTCGLVLDAVADEAKSPPPHLDVHQAYSAARLSPVTYDVEFAIVVTAPYHTKTLKVWLPLPRTDAAQKISNRQLSTFPLKVEPRVGREPVYGNEFAYFEFDHPEGAQIIRHSFRAKVWELHWGVDAAKVESVESWPETFDAYLQPQPSLAEDASFRSTLAQIVPERKGVSRDLISVFDWVDQNIKYDHVTASLKADARFAFTQRRGHCSDYHGLCATMGRSLGYPTRVTYGLNLFPKNSPSHCKLEAFLPPYGWVSFDISETQRMVKAIRANQQLTDDDRERLTAAARDRLTSGFRDNTWLLVTKGTDYDLVPPASQRVPVVRTIYAEADGVPLPDPDPANPEKREFGWMTAHEFKPDRAVTYPFQDVKSLEAR